MSWFNKTISPLAILMGLFVAAIHIASLFFIAKYSPKLSPATISYKEPIRTYIINSAPALTNAVEQSKPSLHPAKPAKNNQSKNVSKAKAETSLPLQSKSDLNRSPKLIADQLPQPIQPPLQETANNASSTSENSALENENHDQNNVDTSMSANQTNQANQSSSIPSYTHLGQPSNASVDVDINHLNCQAVTPTYPILSRHRGESGLVMIEMIINALGRVEHARVKTSSGFQALDNAALKAALASQCQPYIINGQAVSAITDRPYHFTLSK